MGAARRPVILRLAFGTLALGAALLVAAPALASHYRLGESGLVSEAERAVLGAQGVTTTIALLDATAKLRDRRKLAKATKLPMKRLTDLASHCDLMRIDGVGERMARLLRAADVLAVPVLAKQAADSLATKLNAANARARISEVVPGAATLAHWIAQARALPRRVQGL
jgi:hypothetical protein